MTSPMIRNRTLLSGVAALLLAACSQEVPTDKVPEPAQQNEQKLAPQAEAPRAEAPKPEGRGHFRGGPHGGPGFLLKAALKELELRPDQKSTVEALLADLKQAGPMDSPAHRDFDKALAAGVRAGKLDPAALAPHYAALEKSATEMSQKVHAALNKLHQTLDAEQRQKLVAALEQRAKDGPGRRGPHGPGPHFGPPELEDAPPVEPGAACAGDPGAECPHGAEHRGPGRRGFGGPGGPGLGMFDDLELSDAQKEKLRAARAQGASERAAWKQDMQKKGEHMKQLLATFATDRFDANAHGASVDIARHARQGAEARVKHLETLLGVLEPAQREKLALRVEAGPPLRKR